MLFFNSIGNQVGRNMDVRNWQLYVFILNMFFLFHWFLSFLRYSPSVFLSENNKSVLQGTSASSTSTTVTSTTSTTTVPFICRTLVEDDVEDEMQRWKCLESPGDVIFATENSFKGTLVVVGYIRSGYKWVQGVLDKIMINPHHCYGGLLPLATSCDFTFGHLAESDGFHLPDLFRVHKKM